VARRGLNLKTAAKLPRIGDVKVVVVEAPAPPTADVALDYAPSDTLRRRRRVRRVVLSLILLALAAVGFWYGPTAWRRARNFYAVRYACGYAAPADTVVYSEGPGTARPLLANPPAGGGGGGATRPAATVAPDPAAFTRLAAVADAGYLRLFAPRGPVPGPLVFLHERTAPDGRRLLVAVRLSGLTYYPWDGGTLACGYDVLLLRPTDWQSPGGVAIVRGWGGVHIPSANEAGPKWSPSRPDPGTPAAAGEVRVYFGAADGSDASAFTVPYEINGRRKAWHFRLTAQGLSLDEQQGGTGGKL
jgi:hypothetical protein